jgi:hypothetical protein
MRLTEIHAPVRAFPAALQIVLVSHAPMLLHAAAVLAIFFSRLRMFSADSWITF